MFFAINVEDRVAADHPLRPIRRMVDGELARLAPVFERAYSRIGRPSVPPERLLKAMLLQCLYSVRSERQLVERLDTDLLFRWFAGMDPRRRASPPFGRALLRRDRLHAEPPEARRASKSTGLSPPSSTASSGGPSKRA